MKQIRLQLTEKQKFKFDNIKAKVSQRLQIALTQEEFIMLAVKNIEKNIK